MAETPAERRARKKKEQAALDAQNQSGSDAGTLNFGDYITPAAGSLDFSPSIDRWNRGPVNLGTLEGTVMYGSADSLESGGTLVNAQNQKTNKTLSYKDASGYLNELRSAARASNATPRDKAKYNKFISDLQIYTGSEFESASGAEAAFGRLLDDASTGNESALGLLDSYVNSPDAKKSGGSKAYTGPVQSNVSSIMADEDIPRTLNEFATEMLGRNLTKKEMNKYTKKFKKQDRENEQISLRTPNGPAQSSTVTQEKVTRDTIARNIMQENPAYADQTINTDVLDIFAKRLGI